jgi:hypothetical protein
MTHRHLNVNRGVKPQMQSQLFSWAIIILIIMLAGLLLQQIT